MYTMNSYGPNMGGVVVDYGDKVVPLETVLGIEKYHKPNAIKLNNEPTVGAAMPTTFKLYDGKQDADSNVAPEAHLNDVVESPLLSRKKIAAGIGFLAGAAGAAAADPTWLRPTYNPTSNSWSMGAQDDFMRLVIEASGNSSGQLYGDGTIFLHNLGGETRELFQLGDFAQPTSMLLPTNWGYSFNGALSITGVLRDNDSIPLSFTFNPQDVGFGRTSFNYFGSISQGTIADVDTLHYEPTTVVPVPGGILLGLIGLATAGLGILRRFTRDSPEFFRP
jgi:hypothetical protein